MTIREPLVVLSRWTSIYVGTRGTWKGDADIGQPVKAGDVIGRAGSIAAASLDQAIAKRDEEKIVATTALANISRRNWRRQWNGGGI